MQRHNGFASLIILPLTIAVSSCADNIESPDGTQVEDKNELTIAGDKLTNGIFDVSVEYGDDGTGWLAYSWIEIPKLVETHLAKTTNGGKDWTFVGALNHSSESTIEKGGKSVKGAWREETPSLLFDPADQPARRWKLFTNRYFAADPYKPESRHMSDGSIEMRYAERPDGAWSDPVCVVGDTPDCKLDIRKADSSLANIQCNTEPSAIVANGVIYMALDGGTTDSCLGDWENYRVIMLASADHGGSWKYAGTLLDNKDSTHFGYVVFTGTSLVRANGKLYVLATPSGGMKKSNKGHDGVMVMEIADIATASIKREPDGSPAIVKRISPSKGSGGLADYDENNTAGSMLFSQINILGLPEIFKTFEMQERIAPAP